MPSITPMMSETLTEAFSIWPMVVMTSPITTPPSAATREAAVTDSLACWAELADWLTVAVISSIEAAVCCRLAAADSVRCDRSVLPAAISSEAARTDSLASRIWRMMVQSLSAKVLKARAICATSSLPSAGRRWVRSPSPEPMASMASRTVDRPRSDIVATPQTTAAAMPAISTSAITDAISTERMPAVASALSSATMTIQSVPGTKKNETIAPIGKSDSLSIRRA
ncbi:hypothetical protein D9M72_232930 [compost metagenome]